MSHAAELPLWAGLATGLLVVLGAGLTLLGTLGLLRFPGFYDRIHAPTLGTTLGIGCVLLASMLFFTVTQSRPVLHEVVVAVFMVVTTPVTLMLLARAALYRDEQEKHPDVVALRREEPPEGAGRP